MSVASRIKELFTPTVWQVSLSADAPAQVLNYTAKSLYNSQANLAAVINFLSKSVAQLPLNVYKRNGENDRTRDRTSVAAMLLRRPNEDQTTYDFIDALMHEYLLCGCVYVWLLPDADADSGYQLRIIPSDWVKTSNKRTLYAYGSIVIIPENDGKAYEIPATEFTTFKTYAIGNPRGYVSPISALRQTLEEQIQAGKFRKELWASSGRLNAQIVRPANVQPWDEGTRERFVKAFREAWGAGGSKAGSIPVMEDGMEIKPFNTSFKEQQWAESIKLSREDVAAAYSVNPSLVWHSDTQTYASSKDNARALYAECLGPVLQMLQQRINSFLLPMIGADPDTYVEFDLKEKLKGSFEERAAIKQAAVGGPWMSRNEARADDNLPPVDGGDDLIVPLNVSSGAQSAEAEPEEVEQEKHEQCICLKHMKAEPVRIKGRSDEQEDADMTEVLQRFFRRQAKSVLPKIGAGKEWWDADRWNEELTADILPLMEKISDRHGADASDSIGTTFVPEMTRKYLAAMANGRATAYNASTKKKLDEAIESEGAEDEITPADVFEKREEQSETLGRALATATASWAVLEASNQAERDGRIPPSRIVEKEWVTGANARMSHAMMNGERVPVDENFSNGAYWPGDDVLGPEETCGCNCAVEIIITEV